MPLTPSDADKRAIAAWLTRLIGVTRHSADNPIDRETLADYTELLALDFPTTAFNALSLRAVATGSEWFPAYDKIRREIGDWWSANKPPAPTLPSPQGNSLPSADRAALDSFNRRHNGPDAASQAPRGQALSMLHDYFHGAWREMMRDLGNRSAYEDWINQGNTSRRLPWNHRAIAAARAAETRQMAAE